MTVGAGGVALPGHLGVPEGARGVVAFAHGSGSGRASPRNRMVAERLRREGLATLLFDLLTEDEALDRRRVFDIPLLAERLLGATGWLREEPATAELPLGYFGASTGAAAALLAAGRLGEAVRAVVSRGGRPDLAREAIPEVRAPTLLVVGGDDRAVLELNREVLPLFRCPARLEAIPGATHLFEEPGALERVADLAAAWFRRYVGPDQGRGRGPRAPDRGG